MQASTVSTKQENPFLSLVFNIALPILVLEKLSAQMGSEGPKLALLLAIAIQIGYAIYDYSQRRKISPIFVLGLLNVLLTGTLGLLALEGIWFAIKEASFPLLIGLFVFVSSFTTKPLVQILMMNPRIINRSLLDEKLAERKTQDEFLNHLKTSTRLFSASFLLSAVLNFWLARRIFIPIDPALEEAARQVLLNKQISAMTWQGYVVIFLPSLICLALVFWHVFHGVKKYSGLAADEVVVNQ